MNRLPSNPSTKDLVRAGALTRVLKRLAQAWSPEAIILDLEASYIGGQSEQFKAIIQLAYKARGAAAKQQQLQAGQRLDESDIPLLPPG